MKDSLRPVIYTYCTVLTVRSFGWPFLHGPLPHYNNTLTYPQYSLLSKYQRCTVQCKYIFIYTHNKITALPFTDFCKTHKSLQATRADLHRISPTNRLTVVYSVDRKLSYETKYCRAFLAPIFVKFTITEHIHTYI
jgi:hypothetical protein